jgi:hypothetical protein
MRSNLELSNGQVELDHLYRRLAEQERQLQEKDRVIRRLEQQQQQRNAATRQQQPQSPHIINQRRGRGIEQANTTSCPCCSGPNVPAFICKRRANNDTRLLHVKNVFRSCSMTCTLLCALLVMVLKDLVLADYRSLKETKAATRVRARVSFIARDLPPPPDYSTKKQTQELSERPNPFQSTPPNITIYNMTTTTSPGVRQRLDCIASIRKQHKQVLAPYLNRDSDDPRVLLVGTCASSEQKLYR